MAKLVGALICLLIVAMDVMAGTLGIEAEIAQNKVKQAFKLWIFECKEPSQQAFKLGLGAAALLGVAHVIANLLGGCNCNICSQEEFERVSPSKQLSLACLIFTWITFAVGLPMLAIGTLSNHKSRAFCGFSYHFLSIGGILCFVHALFCVSYYVSTNATFIVCFDYVFGARIWCRAGTWGRHLSNALFG